jgi:hypothetical protein
MVPPLGRQKKGLPRHSSPKADPFMVSVQQSAMKNKNGLQPGARLRAGIVKIIADAANAVKLEESLAIFTKTEAIERIFAN